MRKNFKIILPWVLVIILLSLLLWPEEKKTSESIIESQLRVEESLVDSFSLVRDSIVLSKDSALQRVDTAEVSELVNILKNNIYWYENKNINNVFLPGDSTNNCPAE